MSDLGHHQMYLIEEFAEDYLNKHLARRALVKRVLLITGSVPLTGTLLFSLGCGRLLEGNAAQMFQSLAKLAALPAETLVCCGHEYTLANARFALTVDPDNAALRARAAEVERLRAANQFTLPVKLGAEKSENPFLRADDPAIARHLGLEGADALAVFTELRERKNRF